MSRPRFLADQNFNQRVLDGVHRREPTLEFYRAIDLGLSRQSDSELLAYAMDQKFIVVTHDVNTMIDAANRRMSDRSEHAGVLLVQQTAPIRPIIESLIMIWALSEAEEWHATIAFLPL